MKVLYTCFFIFCIEQNECIFPGQTVTFISLVDRVPERNGLKMVLKTESQGTLEVTILIYPFDTSGHWF